jgi:hypothetical protein
MMTGRFIYAILINIYLLRYRALFYTPLYTFLHNLLNVLVQIANKMGTQKSL